MTVSIAEHTTTVVSGTHTHMCCSMSLAIAVSTALTMIYCCCVILKVETLTETEEVSAVLSPKLRSLFDMPVVVLTAILLVCTLGTFVFLGLLVAAEAAQQRLRRSQY